MNKIIKRAGLQPWPKTFRNLRSTRETELFKLTGNVKAVCTWTGNSPDVTLKHYAQITEADQREAVKMTVLDSGKKRVQTAAANTRKLSHKLIREIGENLCFCGEKPEKTKACDSMREADLSYPLGRAGFELSTEKRSQVPRNKELNDTSPYTPITVRVQNTVHILQKHPELQQVVNAWAELPEHIKQTIETLVGSVNIKTRK